jgi:hypothetical protein
LAQGDEISLIYYITKARKNKSIHLAVADGLGGGVSSDEEKTEAFIRAALDSGGKTISPL